MNTFDEIDLIAPVQRALSDLKYSTPTPIQAKTIPSALLGRDVLGCAQTGTGKTAAFALPLLHRLGQRNARSTPNRPAVLVLAPTRELAIQIGDSFARYGKHLRLRQALVYGGVSQARQVRALKRGAHILVATPGRLLDLMNQGHIALDRLEAFVLDEVDRMLDMGFLPDLKRIIRELPNERQSLFFSATLPPRIVELAKGLLRKPVKVNVTPKSPSLEKIDQRVLFVERGEKQDLLQSIVTEPEVDRALVFTRTKRCANLVATKLNRSGIRAAAIHGNKSQNARQQALAAFERREVQVLVATDIASRGIDIEGITHVVNFDLPTEPASYVHRIGRTGRAGKMGIAFSLCSVAERGDLVAIERFIGKQIDMPDGQQRPSPRPARRRSKPTSRPCRPHAEAGESSPRHGKPTRRRRRTRAGPRPVK